MVGPTIGLCMSEWPAGSLAEGLEQVCELKERVGVDSVEICMERYSEGTPCALWPWEFDNRTIARLRPLLREFGHKGVHLPFAFSNLAAPNPRIREVCLSQVEQALDVCGALGLDYAVSHLRYGTLGTLPRAEENRLLRQALERLGDRGRRNGAVFTVENADLVHLLDDVVEVVAPLAARNVGITLDTGHANYAARWVEFHTSPFMSVAPGGSDPTRRLGWGSYGSPASFIRAQWRLVKNVHLHDNDGSGDQHLPPGGGTIDLESFLEAMGEVGAAPVITFEFFVTEAEYLTAAEKVRRWWQRGQDKAAASR